MKRQTYDQKYPIRSGVANIVVAICLTLLVVPFTPSVEINIVLAGVKSAP